MSSSNSNDCCSTSGRSGQSGDDYNGQSTSKYCWSQTITDVDVKIPVDKEIKKGKQVLVEIGADSIKVVLIKNLATGTGNENEEIVAGKLTFPIVKEDSYWNLIPGECISIFLQKKQERWWTACLEGEPNIDMKTIEPVKNMADLHEEEQMKIQEMMYNQQQKQKGLPSSEEQKMQDILKTAWDKEGSPFKGQKFDPSIINFQTNPNETSQLDFGGKT